MRYFIHQIKSRNQNMDTLFTWLHNGIGSEPTEKKEIPSLHHRRIGFEDIKHAQKNGYLLINTLPVTSQGCLITGTIEATKEEDIINDMITHDEMDKIIILYGANSTDTTADGKLQELQDVGFRRVYLYSGGLFEWLLLQDIYGEEEFSTTSKADDLLAFKAARRKF